MDTDNKQNHARNMFSCMVPGVHKVQFCGMLTSHIDCCKAQIGDPILPIQQEPEATRDITTNS